MGFTKLDEHILQSSIMAEPVETFKVFIAILAATGRDGIAKVSSTFLAAACYLPLNDVDSALAALEAPDPRSRSLNEEGRRIKRIDGGYFVINYEKYRDFSYSDNPESIRKRVYRHKGKTGHVGTCPGHSASASASASELFKQFLNTITPEDRELWKVAYPACDVDIEAAKASDWIISNPTRGRKSNYRRFFTGWLKRSQDRGGTIRTSGRGADFESAIDRMKLGKKKQ